VHAPAGVGEELNDERHSLSFTPHVLLHELFRPIFPRSLKDPVHISTDAAEDLIEFVVSFVGIRGTFGRQHLRSVLLLWRKVVLENLREITLKVFLVESVIRLELLYQKKFQCFKHWLSHQSPFQATPSEDLPLQGQYVGNEHFVDHIDRLYRRADAREKLVISGGILALEEQLRAEHR